MFDTVFSFVTDKGYIDLSKRRLSDEEKVKCANKFEKVIEASIDDPRYYVVTDLVDREV